MSYLPRSEVLKTLVKHFSIRNREEWGSLHVLPRNFVVTKTDLPGKLKIMGNPLRLVAVIHITMLAQEYPFWVIYIKVALDLW